MNSINQIYANLPGRQEDQNIGICQSEAFFHLAVAKDNRISALKSHFSKNNLRKIYVCGLLGHYDLAVDEIEALENNFFCESDQTRRAAKKTQLESCLVIVNIFDLVSPEQRAAYVEFFEECTTTCFVSWDWDNHHMLEASTFLATHTDIYAPAHHENLYLLSRYNWLTVGPVYCSSVQWTRKFLMDRLPEMQASQRSDTPLGVHVQYPFFHFRNQVVTTLAQYYPSVGFKDINQSYLLRTPEDRLNEWAAHKTHWIVPVLNDVPIRIWDALITGGIPILPTSLQMVQPIRNIPREHIVFYSPLDIVNPQALIDRANTLFDKGGQEGIAARHQLALQHHHGNVSINHILNFAAELIGINIAH